MPISPGLNGSTALPPRATAEELAKIYFTVRDLIRNEHDLRRRTDIERLARRIMRSSRCSNTTVTSTRYTIWIAPIHSLSFCWCLL